MKSKILSFNILAENAKKQISVPVLIILGFFLCMPIAGIIYLQTLKSGNRTDLQIIQAYTKFLVGTNMPFLFSMTLGSAVLTGVSGFSWLHSRVQTDFYHSLPLRREKMFVNQVLLGIAYYTVPYLVNLLLAYAVGIVHGVFRGNMIRLSLASFLYQFLFYLLIYFVVALSMLLTGKILLGCLGAAVLLFYAPGLDLMLQALANTFFETYSASDAAFSKTLQGLSPIISYFTCLPDDFQSVPGKVLGLGFLAAAILALLCFFLYQKRPSEAAGRSMAFLGLGKVIQYLIEALVILFAGTVFYDITRASLGWLVFGILFGGVLIHGIMEVIYEGDLRRAMAHPWLMGISMVTALLVIGVFYGDVFGYDDFFPKQEDLATVWIQSDDNNYGFYDNGQRNPEEITSMEKMAGDPQVYEVLRQIQENRLWKTKETLSNDTKFTTQDGKEVDLIRRIRVEYGLKSGRNTQRVYYVDYSKCREKMLVLYDSLDYKKTIYPLTTMTRDDLEEKIREIQISSITGHTSTIFSGSSEARADFLETFRAELMQLDQEAVTQETPVGRLCLEANWQYGDGTDWSEVSAIDNTEYCIYPSFTKTLAALKAQNVELPEEFSLETITAVTLYDHRGDEEESKKKKITDPHEIAKVLPMLLSQECSDDLSDTYGYQVFAEIDLKENGYRENVTCLIRRDRLPDLSEIF